MHKNTQVKEPRATGDGTTLDVHSVFYTIQGEGPYSGIPAVFIRLAGCNLQCPGCDTSYTDGRNETLVDDLVNLAQGLQSPKHNKRPQLYVITGGEPFRQNITPLVVALLTLGAMVQIETNGTFGPPEGFPQGVKVVCSPKSLRVATTLLPFISAYKYVLEAHNVNNSDGLPTSVLGALKEPARPHATFKGPIYVSPMDAQSKDHNALNVQTAAHVCMLHGYILNLQIHKLIGLP